MPLVLDPDGYSIATLRELLDEQIVGVTELLDWAAHPAAPVRESLGVVTAVDLLKSALAVGREAVTLGASRAVMASAINVQYEATIAAIDLVKMHSELPKVPRGPKADP